MDPMLADILTGLVQVFSKRRTRGIVMDEEETLCYHSTLRALSAHAKYMELVFDLQLKKDTPDEPPEKDDPEPPEPEALGPSRN